MKSMPYIQNFNGRRALIICDDSNATTRLDTSLMRMGICTEYVQVQHNHICLSEYQLCSDRDLLFLDGDLNTSISIPSIEGTHVPMIPVVGMVGIEAPSRLSRLLAHGATAFIKKPIHVGSVFFNLFIAINNHQQSVRLSVDINKHKVRHSMRRYVFKAILLIMEHQGIDDESAYEWLRRKSMDAQTPLEELSRIIVESDIKHIAIV